MITRMLLAVLTIGLSNPPMAQENPMRIRVVVDGKSLTATLADNATARDLRSLLPLTVTLEDYAATEKITYLSRKLSTAGAPDGSDPAVGSIAYYAPWGNVAFFYKDAPYARGLIPLGRIDTGIEVFRTAGPLKARIEAAD
jgi:hypothetical protein